MNQQFNFLSDGGTTTVQGFQAGATFAGMKTFTEEKRDLGILYSELPCTSAGVFTTNEIISPSIALTRKHVQLGAVRAVVANSGIANTVVGEPGRKDALEVVERTAAQLGLEFEEVGFLSTGIIGVELPMALIRAALPKIQLSSSGGTSFARAIMTTDTHPKEAAISYD